MEEKIYISPRGEVHYWFARHTDAARPCLVFLHGLLADHTTFDGQTACFVQDYTVLAWDAPAHGSSRPYRDVSCAHAAEDLHSILLREGITCCALIGQSMGGFIGQSFLLRWPEMVRAFVGIDTCPYGTGYYSAADRWWLRQVGWMAQLYPDGVLRRSIAKNATRTSAAYENMLRAMAPYSKKELCCLLGVGMAGLLEENQDMTIPCPVLLLVGEFDKTGKVRQYCAAWHARTGYPLCIVQNAAHNANFDQPAAVNARLADFFQNVL